MDYQGVRYIALDSQQALQSDEMMQIQAAWLREVLSVNPNNWTVVTYHHPMFSVSQGRDNPRLREHWQPVLTSLMLIWYCKDMTTPMGAEKMWHPALLVN
jgi:hypothetical protein